MRRNYLIAGFILLAVLGIISVVGLGLLWISWQKTEQPQSSQKFHVSEVTYCAPDTTNPCIESFGFDADGNMLVNLSIPDPAFPGFYLKIVHDQGEARYECQMVEDLPTSFYCIGTKMPPGELLQFILMARKDDTPLASGELSILGLAYPTIEIVLATPTPSTTETPGGEFFTETPTPSTPGTRSTPTQPNNVTPTRTPPSYP